MTMLKKRYPSMTEEEEEETDEDDDGSEESEEDKTAVSNFEDSVRRRTGLHILSKGGFSSSKSEEFSIFDLKPKSPKLSAMRKAKSFDVSQSSNSLDLTSHLAAAAGGGGSLLTTKPPAPTLATSSQQDLSFRAEEQVLPRKQCRKSSGGATLRHISSDFSSSLARTSKERKLSGTQAAKPPSGIRRSSRGSRKNSDDDKLFNPSRVSFMDHNDKTALDYLPDDTGANIVIRKGTGHRTVGDRHLQIQRTVSSPGDPKVVSSSSRDSPLKYERSVSTASSSARPRIRVIPPSSPPLPIIKINAEYTSLADELENVVMARLSPPSTPHVRFGRVRHHSEGVGMSIRGFNNPLRDAEETDFLIMEGLIQKRLQRDSENLAISLEESCSIHTDASEHDITLVVQPSPPLLQAGHSDFITMLEKSPTFQDIGRQTEPEFQMDNNTEYEVNPIDNRARKLGHFGELKKRHSIGSVDTSRYIRNKPSHTTVQLTSSIHPDEEINSSAVVSASAQHKFNKPKAGRIASPEPTHIDSPNSPQLGVRIAPVNLNLNSLRVASGGLLPPPRPLASPVHSLLIVDQSVVPLGFTSGDISLFPPSQHLRSPTMQQCVQIASLQHQQDAGDPSSQQELSSSQVRQQPPPYQPPPPPPPQQQPQFPPSKHLDTEHSPSDPSYRATPTQYTSSPNPQQCYSPRLSLQKTTSPAAAAAAATTTTTSIRAIVPSQKNSTSTAQLFPPISGSTSLIPRHCGPRSPTWGLDVRGTFQQAQFPPPPTSSTSNNAAPPPAANSSIMATAGTPPTTTTTTTTSQCITSATEVQVAASSIALQTVSVSTRRQPDLAADKKKNLTETEC